MINTFSARLLKKTNLTRDVATFAFEVGTELDFAPGQYLVMHIPASAQASAGKPPRDEARRIFSFVNTPGSLHFELLAKLIPGGVASEYFLSLNVGDNVEFAGPAGVFMMRPSNNDKLLVATGTGIAPLLSMLRTHLPHDAASKITLLWGLKTKEDIYCLSELEAHTARYPHFSYFICLSRQASLDPFDTKYKDNIILGRVNKKLDELIRNSTSTMHNSDFYISGDRNIVESLRQHLLTLDVDRAQISFEKFV